ncbi:hypothetical protein D1872_232650 [compost metagenome]
MPCSLLAKGFIDLVCPRVVVKNDIYNLYELLIHPLEGSILEFGIQLEAVGDDLQMNRGLLRGVLYLYIIQLSHEQWTSYPLLVIVP